MIAVDVGYGQLHWRLRNDDRVVVVERTNVRYLEATDLPWLPEGITGDLSFISLVSVLPALARIAPERAELLVLVKPQFEVGRGKVGRGGVVRDPELWTEAITGVVDGARALGLGLRGVVPSEVPGPKGNREFFVHLERGAAPGQDGLIEAAVREVA